MSEQKNYSGSIALSKLKHVIMEKKGKKGKKVKGLFIPIKANHLVEGKEGAVYMPIRVIAKSEEDQYGQHGFVSQSADSKEYKKLKEKGGEKFEEIQNLPILGNIKDFSNAGSSNDNAGAASKETFNEDDDLPF